MSSNKEIMPKKAQWLVQVYMKIGARSRFGISFGKFISLCS
jgi:hypothetical protein